jgi:hypothetical protein
MNIVKTLRVLLSIQILMFGFAVYIMYASSHDSTDDFGGLAAFLPLGIFGLLGFVSFVLLIVHIVKVANKKVSLDVVSLILVVLNVILVVLYDPLTDWALSGPS